LELEGGKYVQHRIDSVVIDAWTEFIRLCEMGALDSLDHKSRDILFAVAKQHSRGEPVMVTDVVASVKSVSSYSATVNRIRMLVSNGWLEAEVENKRNRGTAYSLTPKSISFINNLSQIIRNHVTLNSRAALS
jgi:predicted transcriptional regulator